MPPQDPSSNNADTAGAGAAASSSRRLPFALERLATDDEDVNVNVHRGGGGNDDEEECMIHQQQQHDSNINSNNNFHHHQQEQQDQERPRPPGELERFESRRALRESQGRILVDRRKSFIVEFSRMKGPPQIAFLMALLAIGLGSTMGVVPAIMTDRFARLNHGYDGEANCDSYSTTTTSTNTSNTNLNIDKPNACFLGSSDAQAAASVSNLIQNSLTFMTASLMGSVSDEYGRKGPLLLGLVLAMIPSLCLYTLQYVPTMNPWWYYATNASQGLVSWMAVALSALNDVLPKEFRAPGIGLLFAGFLFGLCLSPTLSLFLERTTLCLVSFGVVLVGFLGTMLCVPETLKPHVAQEAKRRRKERDDALLSSLPLEEDGINYAVVCSSSSSSIFLLRQLLMRPFQEMSILNRNCFFRLISALAFFTGMVNSGDQVLLIYYLEDQLDFTQTDISKMFLIVGFTGIFVQVFVMKPLNDRVGEKMVVAISFLAGSVVNVLYGVAHHKSTIFAALWISGFSNMSFPTISAMKANNVEDHEQGRIQGALYSVKALASGVGPALLQFVYSKTKNGGSSGSSKWFGPGTMFLFAAGLFVVAVGLALALPSEKANTTRKRNDKNIDDNDDDDDDDDDSYTAADGDGGGMIAMDDDELNEYRRLASSDTSSSSYGSID